MTKRNPSTATATRWWHPAHSRCGEIAGHCMSLGGGKIAWCWKSWIFQTLTMENYGKPMKTLEKPVFKQNQLDFNHGTDIGCHVFCCTTWFCWNPIVRNLKNNWQQPLAIPSWWNNKMSVKQIRLTRLFVNLGFLVMDCMTRNTLKNHRLWKQQPAGIITCPLASWQPGYCRFGESMGENCRCSLNQYSLVVWLPFFYVPIYWVANHPNWLSYFSEGRPNHQSEYIDTWWLICCGTELGINPCKIPCKTLRKDIFFGWGATIDHLWKKTYGCGASLMRRPQVFKAVWNINTVNMPK